MSKTGRLNALRDKVTQMVLEDEGRLEFYKQKYRFSQHPGKAGRLRKKIYTLEGKIIAYNNVLHMLGTEVDNESNRGL